MSGAAKHAIVVGAGIVGASIAYHLALRGARVTVVEAGEPGGVATAASWAWINASAGNPEPYVRLRMRSMAMWRMLGAEFPALDVRWTGGLLWDMSGQEIRAFAAQHGSWGYDVRLVGSAEAARLEPGLVDPPDFAAYAPAEGSVEPYHAAKVLLEAAAALGAVSANAQVSALISTAGKVTGIDTSAGRIDADEVVVAAGIGSPALLVTAGVGLPIDQPPGLLVVTKPAPPLLSGLVMAPDLHMRQRQR